MIAKKFSLNFPYPKAQSDKEILFSSALIAGTAYFFLAVFQPFGTYNFCAPGKHFLLIPYAIIAFVAFAVAGYLLKRKAGKWSLAQELTKVGAALLLCSLFNYQYSVLYINNTPYSFRGLAYMSLFTFALGLPCGAIYVLVRFVFLRTPPAPFSPKLTGVEEIKVENPVLSFFPNLQIMPALGSPLTLAEKDFLFAESAGNYCYVFYLINTVLKKELLRIPIKELEAQISSETILRCHRSFLVNTGKVVQATGNAQGYKLHFENEETAVPVSRSYVPAIRKTLVSRPGN